MIKFIEAHPKLAVAVALVLVFLGGLGLGYTRGKGNIVTKEVVKTQIQEHTVYKDRVVTQKVYVAVEEQHTHEQTTTTKQKDGTVVTTTTKDTDTDNKTNVNTNKTDDKSVTQDKVVVQTVEKLKLVDKELTWRIGAGAGYSFAVATGGTQLGVPGLKGWVVQAHVDRHIAGPVWLGLFGNTQGTFGLDASVEW